MDVSVGILLCVIFRSDSIFVTFESNVLKTSPPLQVGDLNNVDLNSIKDISKDDTEKNFIHVDDTLGSLQLDGHSESPDSMPFVPSYYCVSSSDLTPFLSRLNPMC
jgi:hypothetical protein